MVGRLDALWEESPAGPAAEPARKCIRCRRFYYLSEVAHVGPRAEEGVLSSDVVLDRVALEHVVRGCTVEAEVGPPCTRTANLHRLRRHYNIVTREWVALKPA